ncbi:MAG: nicotinamide mononucleotide transporter [Deltaproteobacteria bacterium]|nr:nicotinamide mononucleotide transporter [Deltaproteobacteria bacterium]
MPGISWFLTFLSIVGAVMNVRKMRSSFAVYTIANMGWVAVDIYYGVYAQAALFVVFTVISIWGWLAWGRRPF